MPAVEIRIARAKFADTLGAMRDWLDHNASGPVKFETASEAGGTILICVDFPPAPPGAGPEGPTPTPPAPAKSGRGGGGGAPSLFRAASPRPDRAQYLPPPFRGPPAPAPPPPHPVATAAVGKIE